MALAMGDIDTRVLTDRRLSAMRRSTVQISHLSAGYELVFKNVSIRVDSQRKEILKGISGVAVPGEMLAIMGPSGAGKSTLLNAIAGRKALYSGSVTLNGRPLTKQMRRKISYVLQHDTFLSELSFWDTVWYTALLRLPESMPTKEKKKRTDEIIDALDMRKCLNTIIGDATKRGLSGGEKKRANIACELLTNPALMLLDEPTSGLDSATAYSLICTLKDFAEKSGKTVITTIHQPSSQIFNMFDKLLLLCEGEVAYFGAIDNCADYFADIGLPCPANYNLADHILDVVKDPEPEVKQKVTESARKLKEAELSQGSLEVIVEAAEPDSVSDDDNTSKAGDEKMTNELTDLSNGGANAANDEVAKLSNGYNNNGYIPSPGDKKVGEVKFDDLNNNLDAEASEAEDYIDDFEMLKYLKEYEAKWPTGFWLQFRVLTERSCKQALPRFINRWSIIQNLVLSLFVGVCWFQTKREESYLSDRTGLPFYCVVFCSFQSMAAAIRSFPVERPVINKERMAGYYRLSAYYLAKTVSELMLAFALPSMFFTIIYWMSNLNESFLVYLQMWGIILLAVLSGYSVGLIFGALILDFGLSLIWAQTTILFLMLSGGFYVQNLPVWLEWFQYLSYIQYAYFAILTVDFTNINITCARTASRYCNDTLANDTLPFIPTQVLLDELTKSDEGWELWHNIVAIVGLVITLRTSTYFVLRFLNKPQTV